MTTNSSREEGELISLPINPSKLFSYKFESSSQQTQCSNDHQKQNLPILEENAGYLNRDAFHIKKQSGINEKNSNDNILKLENILMDEQAEDAEQIKILSQNEDKQINKHQSQDYSEPQNDKRTYLPDLNLNLNILDIKISKEASIKNELQNLAPLGEDICDSKGSTQIIHESVEHGSFLDLETDKERNVKTETETAKQQEDVIALPVALNISSNYEENDNSYEAIARMIDIRKNFFESVRRVFNLGKDELKSRRSDSILDTSKTNIWEDDAVIVIDRIPVPVLEFKECTVCLQESLSEKVCKPLGCQHLFCLSCIKSYLESRVTLNKVEKIQCMQDGCKEFFTEKEIKQYTSSQVFQKYQKFLQIIEINRNPNLKRCPSSTCEKIVQGGPNVEKVKCECGTDVCFKCGQLWHDTYSCEEALSSDFKKYKVVYDVNPCPRCGSQTEKDLGCNHMTCTICLYDWCWICRGEYTSDHYSKLNPFGCPGMKFSKKTSQAQRLTWKVIIFILWIIGIGTFPLILFLFSAFWPSIWWVDRRRRSYQWIRKSSCSKIFECVPIFLAGVAISPLTFTIGIVLTIIPGSCLLVRERIRRKKNSQRRNITQLCFM